jgi:hypothetical protein
MTHSSGQHDGFSFVATSFTVLSAPAGSVSLNANFEGRLDDLGKALGTIELSSQGPDFGVWSCRVVIFPDAGSLLTGNARGGVDLQCRNRWNTQGVLKLSDGREFHLDGKIDLDQRSWIGQLGVRS